MNNITLRNKLHYIQKRIFIYLYLIPFFLILIIDCDEKNSDSIQNGLNTSNPDTIFPEINSDYWVATDALDRDLPTIEETGPTRKKYVGIFYWTWHCEPMVNYSTIGNITEILRKYPEALTNANHPAWNRGGGNTHFWEQPLFGYYRTTDPWILRKHAEMLADAKIDVVFFDCTNPPFTWASSYYNLFAVWSKAKNDGVKVPKVAFLLPFSATGEAYNMLKDLYLNIYAQNKYSDLWFMWKGKPLIMAYQQSIPNDGSALNNKLKEFFTYRPGQPDYVNGPDPKYEQWGWLEIYPQHKYMARTDGTCEEVPVGVAQNASPQSGGHCCAFNIPNTYGRSYTRKNGWDNRDDAYLYGLNFQEQWERALEIDPDLIFVTGWNEWIAGKWDSGWEGDPFSFVDQYDWEHSRDIEPNKGWGEKGDVYYYQLIQNTRKFKGMEQKKQSISPIKSIVIGKGMEEWDEIYPNYYHYRNNVMHRNHPGHANTYYTNNTGRNDFINTKIARDENFIYFYVETNDNITIPKENDHWMWIFIDIDRNKSTGWHGYDYLINYNPPMLGKGKIAVNKDNEWKWELSDEYDIYVEKNKMEIKVSRNSFNVMDKNLNFEFKLNDNMQEVGNIMDFYVNGDTAPGGRFNFVFSENNN